MITVVGMGPGASAYLTQAAVDAIAEADILVGGRRHIISVPDFHGETHLIGTDIEGLLAWMAQRQAQKIVVLASGDPLFYGIGKRVCDAFSAEVVRIVPGVSAIQYLCAQIGLDMNDIYLTSSHGRTPDFDWLLTHKRIGMVTDANVGPHRIAQEILARGQKRRMVIGENLSQLNECISVLSPEQVVEHYAMNVVVIDDER